MMIRLSTAALAAAGAAHGEALRPMEPDGVGRGRPASRPARAAATAQAG
jgi:hypothetical protein